MRVIGNNRPSSVVGNPTCCKTLSKCSHLRYWSSVSAYCYVTWYASMCMSQHKFIITSSSNLCHCHSIISTINQSINQFMSHKTKAIIHIALHLLLSSASLWYPFIVRRSLSTWSFQLSQDVLRGLLPGLEDEDGIFSA